MSTFLEIMGTLSLKDVPEVWIILSRLEAALIPDCGGCGLQIGDPAEGVIPAKFDFSGELSGTGCTKIENDLDALSELTAQAAYLTVGWDNIREKQFFGPPEDVGVLKSRLALEQIGELKKELLPQDIPQAIELLQTNS